MKKSILILANFFGWSASMLLTGCFSAVDTDEVPGAEYAGEAEAALVSYPGLFYNGVGGPGDWRVVSYGPVGSSQTQQVVVEINVGNVLVPPSTHIGIGLRGPSQSQGIPRGRGIILGYLNAAAGCNYMGVAVENYSSSGVVGSSCVPFTFASYGTYRFTVTATSSNVFWDMSAREYDHEFHQYHWEPVLSGQCGTAPECTQLAADGTAGDVFVGQAFGPAGTTWNARNLTINHW